MARGGQVALVTRSGSNETHGNAFWFYRTPSLNANPWQNNFNRVGKEQFVQAGILRASIAARLDYG